MLVDSSHEDQETWFQEVMSPELQAQMEEGAPTEGVDWTASSAEVADTHNLGDMPLIVLTREKNEPINSGFLPVKLRDEFEAIIIQFDSEKWSEWQADLLRLSTNSTQIIAKESGHQIHRINQNWSLKPCIKW